MSLMESKIKLLKKMFVYSEKLLNISNKIEISLNGYFDKYFDYYKFGLKNIHSLNESTFNYRFYNEIYNIKENLDDFSFLYRYLNEIIDFMEKIIVVYGRFIKNETLLKEIESLNLNPNVNISEFFDLI